jgi:hypothetical protein
MIVAAAAAAHLSLLPIVPLLLLPFAIIFFVLVFPLWAAALAVLGLILLILRGLEMVAGSAVTPAANGVHAAFRWVLTFGGFVRLGDKKEEIAQRRT